MPEVRKYVMGFLYRTAICTCLFLICYIIQQLWPVAFNTIEGKLFYDVNYGQLASDLKDLVRCVLPR